MVLVSDCDDTFTATTVRALQTGGYGVQVSDCLESRLNAFNDSYSAVIMELSPAGVPRLELLLAVRGHFPTARIVVVSAYPSLCAAVAALRAGADDYLAKPVPPPELLRAIRCAGDERVEPSELPSLARMEWEHISRVLQYVGGNISAAARILNVQRSTLQRKLRKHPPNR